MDHTTIEKLTAEEETTRIEGWEEVELQVPCPNAWSAEKFISDLYRQSDLRDLRKVEVLDAIKMVSTEHPEGLSKRLVRDLKRILIQLEEGEMTSYHDEVGGFIVEILRNYVEVEGIEAVEEVLSYVKSYEDRGMCTSKKAARELLNQKRDEFIPDPPDPDQLRMDNFTP